MKLFQRVQVNQLFTKIYSHQRSTAQTNVHPPCPEFRFWNLSCEHGYSHLATSFSRDQQHANDYPVTQNVCYNFAQTDQNLHHHLFRVI